MFLLADMLLFLIILNRPHHFFLQKSEKIVCETLETCVIMILCLTYIHISKIESFSIICTIIIRRNYDYLWSVIRAQNSINISLQSKISILFLIKFAGR